MRLEEGMTTDTAKHVVVVDDDPLFRESLGLNLAEYGFNVTDFNDGAGALKHFTNGGTADAVLLDWRMPGIDGLTVLRRMREKDIQVPVIFLTVLSDEIYEEEALHWGAVDFIDKSRSLAIILQRLRLITQGAKKPAARAARSEEHTSELQSLRQIVCRLLLEKKKTKRQYY